MQHPLSNPRAESPLIGDALHQEFTAIGVTKGYSLFVRASLKSIGPVAAEHEQWLRH